MGEARHRFLEELEAFPQELDVPQSPPVRLPPGRSRLATRSCSTRSFATPSTMGMVLVACLAARAAGVECVQRTSGVSRTNSAARGESWSRCPSA